MGNWIKGDIVWKCCIATPLEKRRLVVSHLDNITIEEMIQILKDTSDDSPEKFEIAKISMRRHGIFPQ